MSYIAFALKYRPKNFDEVIGQPYVVTSLRNAILNKRVHHAYLFSGPRGIGKTSLARILAKSLNCEIGPTPKPCDKCLSCVEIAKGNSLDIIEIDGASNRGIDEIRTLRENVKLSTTHSRYKIYIIDEIHMLTQEAFNALLKTLEEPPPHVKFIFATTHPHKILPTILSRCQKFQFNLIPLENIVLKLKKISDTEKIKIKENLLYTIGRASGGSIRDAESLFDQLVPVISQKENLEDIFSFLGIIDEESLNRILKLVIEKNLPEVLSFIDKTAKSGKDLGIFINAFIEHLRCLLLAKISIKNFKNLSDVSPATKDSICSLTELVTVSDILKIIDLLIYAKDIAHKLNTVRIPFELALIKYCYKEEASKFSPKPRQEPSQPSLASSITNDEELAREIDNIDLDDEKVSNKKSKEVKNKSDIELDKPNAMNEALDDSILMQALKGKWKELISSFHKVRAALSSHLSFAMPVSSSGDVVTVAFSKEDSFHKEIVESAKNLKPIQDIFSKFMGRPIGVKFITKDAPRNPSLNPLERKGEHVENAQVDEEVKDAEKEKESDDEFLNELLDTFGGKFHSDN